MKIKNLINSIIYILNHPLNEKYRLHAIKRYVFFQLRNRLNSAPVEVNFVNNSILSINPGQHSSLVVFCGLYDYEDMAFVLHCLRDNDLFIDIGANIGSYTVLASAVAKARSLCFEPVPKTFVDLINNIKLNRINNIVKPYNIGIGSENSVLNFTVNLGAKNHVITENDNNFKDTIRIPVKKLDDVVLDLRPKLIKIDVEGFESEVIKGAHKVLSNESLLALIIEINSTNKRYGSNPISLHRKILDYGFECYLYCPSKRELISLKSKLNTRFNNMLYVRNLDKVQTLLKTAPKFYINHRQIWV